MVLVPLWYWYPCTPVGLVPLWYQHHGTTGVVGVGGVVLHIWPLGPEIPLSAPFLPSYGWGLDYPKSLSLFWEKNI